MRLLLLGVVLALVSQEGWAYCRTDDRAPANRSCCDDWRLRRKCCSVSFDYYDSSSSEEYFYYDDDSREYRQQRHHGSDDRSWYDEGDLCFCKVRTSTAECFGLYPVTVSDDSHCCGELAMRSRCKGGMCRRHRSHNYYIYLPTVLEERGLCQRIPRMAYNHPQRKMPYRPPGECLCRKEATSCFASSTTIPPTTSTTTQTVTTTGGKLTTTTTKKPVTTTSTTTTTTTTRPTTTTTTTKRPTTTTTTKRPTTTTTKRPTTTTTTTRKRPTTTTTTTTKRPTTTTTRKRPTTTTTTKRPTTTTTRKRPTTTTTTKRPTTTTTTTTKRPTTTTTRKRPTTTTTTKRPTTTTTKRPTTTTTTTTAKPTTTPKPLCPSPPPTVSGRLLGGAQVWDQCTGNGVLNFRAGPTQVCNGVLGYDPTTQSNKIYITDFCINFLKALNRTKSLSTFGVYNSVVFPITLDTTSTSLRNDISFIEPPAGVSLASRCQTRACVYNPATMSSDIDFNNCYITSYGYDIDIGAMAFSSGNLKKANVTKQTTCPSSSGSPNAQCFKAVDPIVKGCWGDNGAPVYCELTTTKETVFYGVVDVIGQPPKELSALPDPKLCTDSNVFRVLPLN